MSDPNLHPVFQAALSPFMPAKAEIQPTPDEITRGLQFARNREAARLAHWQKQVRPGVYYSGLSVGPYEPQTEEMLQAEAMQWARMWAEARAARAA